MDNLVQIIWYLHGENGGTDGQHLACHGLRASKNWAEQVEKIVKLGTSQNSLILEGMAPIYSIVHSRYPTLCICLIWCRSVKIYVVNVVVQMDNIWTVMVCGGEKNWVGLVEKTV